MKFPDIDGFSSPQERAEFIRNGPPVPLLGLCMIVRDAADTIEGLLDSVLRKTKDGKPAFDEFVFVDTGSIDDTRERIARAFNFFDLPYKDGQPDLANAVGLSIFPESAADGPVVCYPLVNGERVRLVLARFDWIDDFAAARQASFLLGTAKWRGYLDADDTFPDAHKLRKALERTARESPESNCISFPYDYERDAMIQDPCRMARWADGWHWEDEIHESLRRKPAGPRMFSMYTDIPVIHDINDARATRSFDRNVRICTKIYERAKAAGDTFKMGKMAYFLGTYAKGEHRDAEAERWLLEAADRLAFYNLGTYAAVELGKLALERGFPDAAVQYAARAMATTPELPEGLSLLAVAHYMRRDMPRAVHFFDLVATHQTAVMLSTNDLVWSRGIVNAYAALAYLAMDRDADAKARLAAIPEPLQTKPAVQALYTEARIACSQRDGLQRLKALWEYLIWDTEASQALRLLKELTPSAISDHPTVQRMIRFTEQKMVHLRSWEDYQKTYAAIPDAAYHTPDSHKLIAISSGRALAMRDWAAALPKEGPPVYVLAIGIQDGLIEAEMLAAAPRLRIVACDVAPQATGDIAKLAERFPGRVEHQQIVRSHYDWPRCPAGIDLTDFEGYDAIVIFEVLEHLPDDQWALEELHLLLSPTGTLFLSCPVAAYWVEEYLTDPRNAPSYYGHVRAYNPSALWRLFAKNGFEGTLYTTDNDSTFLAVMQHQRPALRLPESRVTTLLGDILGEAREEPRDIGIYVPGTPQPFDAESLTTGFLGGSEECVVHLAAALAKRGHRVTVYAPRARRTDGRTLHGHAGVLWRTPEDFDAGGTAHEAVLFWRCPDLLLDPGVRAAKYVRALWLHDASYHAAPEAYRAADKVIVLSQAHAEAITAGDGYPGPFALAQNGIDAAQFPPLTEEGERDRDLSKVIYCSSPDRGLERLIDEWPAIREAVPAATLDIYYDWTSFRHLCPEAAERLTAKVEALAGEGVTFIGGVSQPVLHAAMRRAGTWCYPNSGRIETSCITAMKIMASGCWPIAAQGGALPETLGGRVVPGLYDATIDTAGGRAALRDALIGALLKPEPFAERLVMHLEAVERYDWRVTAGKFLELLFGGAR